MVIIKIIILSYSFSHKVAKHSRLKRMIFFFVICIIAVHLLKKSHKCVGAFFVNSGVIINKGIF